LGASFAVRWQGRLRVGRLDLRAQAEGSSALKSDTPM
jgi:hypothetical protein